MTERLYYTDPYLREFDARVVRVADGDGHRSIVLDRTAFYPTSGGQPFDMGRIGDLTVVDVVEEEDGSLRHVMGATSGPSITVGATIHGVIDWERRFDHMQQHTGQHVLSAAFDARLQARTESFHLGTTSSTIDLAREVGPGDIAKAEADANRIVWEDHPVTIRFVDAAEAAKLPMRKESGREGTLRLIDVEGYDLSACGGTHVARTGAIGIVAIASWEKFRGGTRVEFVCGGRALRAFHALRDTTAKNVQLLSVHAREIPEAIERVQAESRDARRRIKDLHAQLARHEAAALADTAGESRIVVHVLEGWDQAGLKTIASAICEREGYTAVLFSAPSPSAVVVARGAGASTDAGAVLKKLTEKFGGKGGGRPDLAQGGGLQGDPQEMASFAREVTAPAT